MVDERTGEQRFPCARCGFLMEPKARSAVCQPCHRMWRRQWDEESGVAPFDEEGD